MLVTHGHGDHTTDVVSVGRATGAQVVAPFELSVWFQQKGLQERHRHEPRRHAADHGPGGDDGARRSQQLGRRRRPHVYAGVATGYVIKFEDGLTVYYAGDTAVFGDMKLIGEIYRPTIAFLPIGDLYTMGPEQAAVACDLLGVKQVVPMHYGTFPALTGTPARLRELVTPRGIEVIELKPGETSS